MFSFDVESITKGIGVVTATFALIGGGYTLYDKLGIEDPILKWAPEYFSVTDGETDDDFKVVVAREKLRDDCKVVDFRLEVRDSEFVVHNAIPSITKFSGPANDKIDKFAYYFNIENDEDVEIGEATLLAHIDYECPEGPVIVNYPDHENLRFMITN